MTVPPLYAAESPRQATVRILAGADGEATAGTGLYVSGGLVATCAHVVREAAGLPDGHEPAAGTVVRLRFPEAPGDDRRPPAVARVVPAGWRPGHDVAILHLEAAAPFAAGWTRARALQPHEALDLTCFGFGDGVGREGGTAAARVLQQAVTGHEADLLNRDDGTALQVEPGYSGAAVCDGLAVLGLLGRRRAAQGLSVARMVLWHWVGEALNAALAATLSPASSATHLAPLFALARDGVADAGRQTNNRNPRVMRALQVLLRDLQGQVGRPDLFESPFRLQRACENLRGLQQASRELRTEAGAGRVPMLGLDGIAGILARLLPVAEAAAPGATVVDNDWEAAAWRDAVEALLTEIDARLTALDARPPGIPAELCDRAAAVLARLRALVLAPTISLADLDTVRAELERLDRDVFEVLIEACELLLGTRAADLPPGAVFRDRLAGGGAGPAMVVIPEGRFLMGSPEGEKGHTQAEGPLHEVQFARRFALARYPVTFAEYDLFCAEVGREPPPDDDSGRGSMPVTGVSWEDAAAYCRWLTAMGGAAYRLPSESEWEYACRAGSSTAYPWGPDWHADHANGGDEGERRTTPVGDYPPNAWGVQDMIGNISEWVEDRWQEDYVGAPVDGSPRLDPDSGSIRHFVRGGSWDDDPDTLRAACRQEILFYGGASDIGFRVARALFRR